MGACAGWVLAAWPFTFILVGVGALAANSLCPYLMQKVFTQGGLTYFRGLFLVPLAIATLAAMVLALFFRPPIKRQAAPALQAVAGAENVSP